MLDAACPFLQRVILLDSAQVITSEKIFLILTEKVVTCRPEPSFFGKAEAKKGPSKGMQLGKAKKGANDFLDSLRAEGEVMVETDTGPGQQFSEISCSSGS